jgi:hypothetical protein
VYTVADTVEPSSSQPVRSTVPAMRLLSAFMLGTEELRPLMTDAGHDQLHERGVVERLVRALWGVFSHHRAVLDSSGRQVDLGSWRAAAEMIADAANRRYPTILPPIRYMDCYMGVLLGEDRRSEARALHRWIFSVLRDAGCDWIYVCNAELATEEQRTRQRELAAALWQAYQENADAAYAPLPTLVAAYEDVYGRLPDGWPL